MKRYSKNKLKTEDINTLLLISTAIFLLLILAVFPVYLPGGYFYISETKWIFFRNTAACYCLVMTALIIYRAFIDRASTIPVIRIRILTDIFALSYLGICAISYMLSEERDVALYGYDTWYMGLIAQALFVLTYIFISWGFYFDNNHTFMGYVIRGHMIGSSLVFALGILMRFSIDPLGLHEGLSAYDKSMFISTLGQASWYSSFLCLAMPVCICGWCFTEYPTFIDSGPAKGKGKNNNDNSKNSKNNNINNINNNNNNPITLKGTFGLKLLSFITMVLGFMSTVTQNSDSAYLAFGAYMLVLFGFAAKNGQLFGRLLEVIVIALSCFKLIGLFRLMAPDRAAALDPISVFLSESNITLVMLLLMVALLILYRKKGLHQRSDRILSPAITYSVYIAAAVLVLALIVYIPLNTLGRIPESMRSDNNYLYFNEYWGNHRGMSWKTAVLTFIREPISLKLFGAGNDCFFVSAYTYYGDELWAHYNDLGLQNAHSEWLNILITNGIFGFAAYLGIYISAFIAFIKRAAASLSAEGLSNKSVMYLCAFAMSIAAYMAHNTFCYQQVICTSTIFALMGMGMAIIRREYDSK